ncbi:DNA repair protein RecO [uncultured Oscillibacter sp.]|uniref:DNA repair protein RecO n=1 Tax=uncultured Oscillibacter sp. TaxID=876091 RepID=UPI0025D6C7E7|nr:DNA repair protein RecO [uncultured Oscillibacter sp.]
MSDLVTRGAVLRETETKESDKILTVLTPDHGKISVIAKGARRKGSRYAAACQTLAYSELTLNRRGDWYYLNEGTTLALFDGLRADFEALALGFYFAELTEAVSSPEIPAPELLSHLLNGLYALDTLKKSRALAKPAFEWRLMCLAGYEPLADGCAVCGEENPADARLDPVQGVLRCAACGGPGGGEALPLRPEAVAALRHIVYGPPGRLYAFTLTGEALDQLSNAAERYVAVQLERSFRTLDYYKSLSNL